MANTFPTAPPGTCPIQKIPLEVLLRISYYLSTPDLGRLRLTSRSIEQALYTTFVNEFFTRKKFMMTQESLRALVDISKSRLSQHLRFVHFGLDHFPSLRTLLSDAEKEERFRKRYSDMFTLWYTGHHRDMMAEAFRNLENLQDVIIRDSDSRRPRDGPLAEWHSYGHTTILNETGVKMEQRASGRLIDHTGFPYRYSSQVFAAVIHALGTAQARPRGIEIMAMGGNCLRDFAFNMPDFLQPSVVPILQRLEKLHLCIDLRWRYLRPENHDDATFAFQSAPRLFIQKFLPHATNLKNLRINENRNRYLGMAIFSDWIARDSAPQTSADGTKQAAADLVVSMPRLEELSLGKMCIDAPSLLKFVRKFAPSLKSLELWRVTLVRACPPRHRQIRPKPEESFWYPFLKSLTEIPGLHLKHFKAGMLAELYQDDPPPGSVSFKGYGPVCEYDGSDWKQFIRDIRTLLDVEWHVFIDDENYGVNNDEGSTDDEEDTSMLDDEDDAAGDDDE